MKIQKVHWDVLSIWHVTTICLQLLPNRRMKRLLHSIKSKDVSVTKVCLLKTSYVQKSMNLTQIFGTQRRNFLPEIKKSWWIKGL